MFKCSKQPNTEAFVLNIFSRRSRGYYGEVGEKFDLPAVQDFGRRVFDIVSPVPLSGSFEFRPARPCLFGRVLQPPQEVRQEQIDAIMQTGLWQAGIRIFA